MESKVVGHSKRVSIVLLCRNVALYHPMYPLFLKGVRLAQASYMINVHYSIMHANHRGVAEQLRPIVRINHETD
jgi:hypothetical protein